MQAFLLGPRVVLATLASIGGGYIERVSVFYSLRA